MSHVKRLHEFWRIEFHSGLNFTSVILAAVKIQVAVSYNNNNN